jgi:nucleoid-associated protein YgaU
LATSSSHVSDVPLRRPDVTLEVSLASEPSPADGLESSDEPAANPVATLEQPLTRPDLDALGPPPQLPADFGRDQSPRLTSWKPARRPPGLQPDAARQHRLTDGDSLEKLAIRYLGAIDRASEIYEANRDVLASPDVLPLGRIIRIPPATQEPALAPVE